MTTPIGLRVEVFFRALGFAFGTATAVGACGSQPSGGSGGDAPDSAPASSGIGASGSAGSSGADEAGPASDSDSAGASSGMSTPAETGAAEAGAGAADASVDATEAGARPDGAVDAAVDGGPLAPDFTTMWSGTVVATPGQQLMTATGSYVQTFRSYVRPRTSGRFRWAFWVSNGTDTTFGGGQAMPNKLGGSWRIDAAYVADGGAVHPGSVVPGSQIPVTFRGAANKTVQPGERFWSDPVSLDLPPGHDLAFTWTLSGSGAGPAYPMVSVPFVTSYSAPNQSVAAEESGAGFAASNGNLVTPQLFAYDRPVTNRLCFLGDSITQGIGSGLNTYGYWVAKIADGLGPDVGVWNLGSGWARAADAASDGFWLYKAKQCNEVAVILGVNDFQSSGRTSAQVLGDLTTVLTQLKANNPSARTILFTVPTFNLTGSAYANWKQTNTVILTTPPAGADRVFDIAATLSQPPPNDGQVKTQYLSGDAHPNDAAGTDIANAFLVWYKK